MKKVIMMACIAAASAGAAFADNPNWSAEKKYQILVNRCSDAGKGNGAEDVINDRCGNFRNDSYYTADVYADMDESTVVDQYLDVDPGNSQDNNANN